ncbi:MAG: bifunctional oligoribonuclease and phosphatase NrnA [Patescibacteria group bacterium]|nr:bifunctional oligoribonuclease and phosphatase NrnA [Patescibacteria group bacterium]
MTENDFEKIGQDILEVIQKSKNILLHLHPSPDPDSVGSALVMAEVLKGLGKEVVIIAGDSPLPMSLSFLPNFNWIKDEGWTDLDLNDFDLLIAQDSGSLEMVSREINIKENSDLKIVVIDHHATNTLYGDINLVVEAPATTQVLFKLISLWGVEISQTIAVNMFVGLYADTGGFKYDYTQPETLAIAGQLIAKNHEALKTVRTMQMQNTPKSLDYKMLAYKNINICAGGRAAVSAISFGDLEDKKINTEDTESVSLGNDLLSVAQWQVIATLVEKKSGEIKVSLRSKNGELYNVAEIAQIFGGGGHKAAAGAKLEVSLEEALEKVIMAIENIF